MSGVRVILVVVASLHSRRGVRREPRVSGLRQSGWTRRVGDDFSGRGGWLVIIRVWLHRPTPSGGDSIPYGGRGRRENSVHCREGSRRIVWTVDDTFPASTPVCKDARFSSGHSVPQLHGIDASVLIAYTL